MTTFNKEEIEYGNLIFTREPGQKIIIGNEIVTITLIFAAYKTATIGIYAPVGIDVNREELYLRKKYNDEHGIIYKKNAEEYNV